nr:hypothetical protein [Pseudomonas sp. M47T1]
MDPLGLDTCPGGPNCTPTAAETDSATTAPAVSEGEPSVPSYDTPYQPLSASQKKTIQAKVADRTASKEEYSQLDWSRRFANLRRKGVASFWSQERSAVRNGEPGTRNWSPEQVEQLKAGKTPTYDGKPMEGHHMYNALSYPQLADKAWNIRAVTRDEHLYRWHGGNFRNETQGVPANPHIPEDF